MSEQQLIEELRSTLDETAAKLRLPSDAAAQARTLGRRRRAARGLLAVVPAAGLLAGFMIAAHASAPRPGSPAGTSAARAAHRPATQTVAYVTSHAEAALATVSHYIVKTTISGAPPPIYTWYDPVSKAGREVLKTRHDKMIDWSQRYGTGNGILIRFTYVDLGARTWSRGTVDGAAAQRIALAPASPLPLPADQPGPVQEGTSAGRGHHRRPWPRQRAPRHRVAPHPCQHRPRLLGGRADVPAAPHRGGRGQGRPGYRLAAEDPGAGEPDQPPADPGRLHAHPRPLTTVRWSRHFSCAPSRPGPASASPLTRRQPSGPRASGPRPGNPAAEQSTHLRDRGSGPRPPRPWPPR